MKELEYLCKEIERISNFPECPPEVEEFIGETIVAIYNRIEELLKIENITIH